MKRLGLILMLFLGGFNSFSQENKPSIFTVGIEQDILPYIFKGYIGTVWFGRDFYRQRISYAQATTPKFYLADGIVSDRVKAFGISFEYFFKEDFKGLWFGPGIGYWTNNVLLSNGANIQNESVIVTFGGGYNYPLTNWLYVSPWVALHSRVSGNDSQIVGSVAYVPTTFTPELSLKIGVNINKKQD